MFLSRWELLCQVPLLVNIASYTAAVAHLSICSLDFQYQLLNVICCGIFLLSFLLQEDSWHMQSTDEFLLTFPHMSHRRGRRKTRTDTDLYKCFKCLKRCNLIWNWGICINECSLLSLQGKLISLQSSLNATLVRINVSINLLDNCYKVTNCQDTCSFYMASNLALKKHRLTSKYLPFRKQQITLCSQ